MIHDTLCPMSGIIEDEEYGCQMCEFIRQIRLDERSKILKSGNLFSRWSN